MELSKEEKELLIFSMELSINSLNQVPSKVLKRKGANKFLIVSQLKQLLVKFKG